MSKNERYCCCVESKSTLIFCPRKEDCVENVKIQIQFQMHIIQAFQKFVISSKGQLSMLYEYVKISWIVLSGRVEH